MTFLRKLHLYIGFAMVPLVIVQALTGLLLRVKVTNALIHSVHTWFKYRFDFAELGRVVGVVAGVLIGAGLLFLAVSGAVLYLNMRIQQWRRRRHAAKPVTGRKA